MGQRSKGFIFLLCAMASAIEATSLDAVILLDSSDASRSQYFQQEKTFAAALVEKLYHKDTRIATYTFGSNTFCQFPFDMYTDKALMKQAVQYMWYSTGTGNLESALRQTLNDAFQDKRGDRECVANTVMVLTHSSISAVAASQVNQIASSKRVRLIIVKFGGSADVNLNALTDGTDRVFNVNSWAILQTSVDAIASKIKSDIPPTGCGLLTQWSEWSVCSITCGQGFRSRTRSCVTVDPTDKPCYADLIDSLECFHEHCTDPVDGKWAYWGSWSKCSKSCDRGSQIRTRTCTMPEPVNGGKPCNGNNTETHSCAEWTCPDCAKTCPEGGVISDDCSYCVCDSLTLFGQITDEMNYTVENAEVFLESSRYAPIAITDSFGRFSVEGVCLMNEMLHVSSKTHVDTIQPPVLINTTHATLPAFKLAKHVPPIITVNPEDKVRLSGQSVSLCCNAVGRPQPSAYKWYKDGQELEHRGTDGRLVIQSTTISDSGSYICYTETEAGFSRSESIQLTVKETDTDSCGPPVQLLQELPAGCHVTNDVTRNSTIDVGSCGKGLCTTSSLHDNRSCSDYWPFHCCESDAVETVDITCDGFTYKTARTVSCACRPCIFKTVVAGRAFGRRDGQEVPLQLGEVVMHGKTVTRTSMSGFFTFEVPRGEKRLVVTFYDSIFKIFDDVLKIIHINEGTETFATIVVPFKPEPIPFQADNGTEIDLGITDTLPASSTLSIPSDAIVTADGKPYHGKVQASITFTDPRNRDDLDAVSGEFAYETPDGTRAPMITYGMFSLKLEDGNGNTLSTNKDITVSVNNDTLGISPDEESNIYLWIFDKNKGIWVEVSQMTTESTYAGRRNLLQNNSPKLQGTIQPSRNDIPELDLFNHSTIRVPNGFNGNIDRPIYINVPVKTPKQGACYMSIALYKDLSLREAYDGRDFEINTYVFDPTAQRYVGKNTARILRNGHVCIPIMCMHLIEVNVKRTGNDYLYHGRSYLPNPTFIRPLNSTTEISFYSIFYPPNGIDQSQPHILEGTVFEGPVYQLDTQKPEEAPAGCSRKNALDRSFMIKFAPFTKAPTLHQVAPGVYNQRLSWYPVSPGSQTFRTCFMKVQILVEQTYDFRVVATSRIGTVNGDQFGSYEVGPTPEPNKTDDTLRAACFEFRCAGLVHDNGGPVSNLDTVVAARFTYSGTTTKCRLREFKAGLNVVSVQDSTKGDIGFDFTADPGNNFGPKFGVFIADKPSGDTQRYCLSGVDSGTGVESIRPDRNPAVIFDCTGK